jgi:isopenicillin-N N-acyltransferase like protein
MPEADPERTKSMTYTALQGVIRLAVVMALLHSMAGCGGPSDEQPVPPEPAASAEARPAVSASVEVKEVPVSAEPPSQEKPAAAAPPPDALVTPAVVDSPEVTQLDAEGAGRLYRVGEHLVCVMEGTPREMGYQYGRLLAETITNQMTSGYLQRSLLEKGYRQEYVDDQAARMARHFPPEYIEEMHAVVDGLKAAGVDAVRYEDVLACAAVAELQHHPPDAPPGCTNFAVFGRWTPDGRLLHARNLDWNVKDGAQDAAVILVWRPKGGIPFMMVGWAGCIGSVSGMNARGITIGEMTVRSPDETFDGLPLLITMRRVLETAETLDEAVAVIQKGPRTLGWNFVIGDSKIPDVRALEVDALQCNVYAPMAPEENGMTGHRALPDAVRRSNHPCGAPQLKKLARMYGEAKGMDLSNWEAVRPLAVEMLKSENTWQRYDWLGRQIEARPGTLDVPEALQLLANGPVHNDQTLHSWVFDPTNQVVYVAVAGSDPIVTATDTQYTRVELAQWFN